jgi:tetratricopeptide (TPR) repeat protein
MFGFFPHDRCKGIERRDFFRFSTEFRQVIYENIPTIGELIFFDPPLQLPAGSPGETKEEQELRLGVEQAIEQGSPVLVGDTLLLPFLVADSTVIARLKGLDQYLIKKVGNDWLEGLSFLLIREFLLIKRACTDSLTGLLSSLHLEEYLERDDGRREGVFVLLSVYPKSTGSFQAKKYQLHTVSLLNTFVEERFPLFYLGQSCFGILCEGQGPEFAAEFAPSLVNYLKRSSCPRVHVASTVYGDASKESGNPSPTVNIMKKAWAALHVATRRGPFAFCNYKAIEDAAIHPLAPPAAPVARWLRKHSRKIDQCCLLLFDTEQNAFADSVAEYAGDTDFPLIHGGRIYLFAAHCSVEKAKGIGSKILQHFSHKNGCASSVNCGIGVFPSGNFKKSELPLNCYKALCHAKFLDPGSVVVCDAVSCNIAGDMHYGDGDLVLAVKEYKRGLVLDPEDGNLLNSLGVCYAQMNRHKDAVECFAMASKLPDDRFMALYNLGLEQQICKESSQAIESFTTALALPSMENEDKARQDMSFQLALLLIANHSYQDGLDLLLPWYRSQKKEGWEGKAFRYLGEAYSGVGNHTEAMKFLQRAVGYDEYDAEVLGLLGEIYLKENEGDDIALRFCEKAAELSPDSLGLQLSLAKAQVQCGDFERGITTLQPCLRNKQTRPAALIQRGVLAYEQGQIRAAVNWFVKAESCPGRESDPENKKIARYFLKKLCK